MKFLPYGIINVVFAG